jgi:hypothetical protein
LLWTHNLDAELSRVTDQVTEIKGDDSIRLTIHCRFKNHIIIVEPCVRKSTTMAWHL